MGKNYVNSLIKYSVNLEDFWNGKIYYTKTSTLDCKPIFLFCTDPSKLTRKQCHLLRYGKRRVSKKWWNKMKVKPPKSKRGYRRKK